LLAEAKAFLNEDIAAEINEVCKRAYGSNYSETVAYPNDKGDFYTDNKFVSGDEDPSEAILKERFREFLFEGRRWYDIRLFSLTSKYSTASADKLLWPIDQNTLTNNKLLNQTPGYKN
ncbi:RagB/SusD family nutrient uptake outer membrane protein, partial [Bacteroides heparinolyticus]|uniref:RagB/SusD family nutrient uptake outer membrane protein n=1 Tax=Prevotella heparinolytica TaxID=28113 RepID=UPI0035A0B4BC